MECLFYLVTTAWLCAAFSPAYAQAVPRYDAIGYCDPVAETVGGSYVMKNGCLEQEQTVYNGLKARWASIPGRAGSYCDEVAHSIGGSYVILEGCIQQEVGASGSTPSFKY